MSDLLDRMRVAEQLSHKRTTLSKRIVDWPLRGVAFLFVLLIGDFGFAQPSVVSPGYVPASLFSAANTEGKNEIKSDDGSPKKLIRLPAPIQQEPEPIEPRRASDADDDLLSPAKKEKSESNQPDPGNLLEQRERSVTPYPMPDFSTPSERVVPIPIVPAPENFPGFEPESPGDWNLPEPRRKFPLPTVDAPVPNTSGANAGTPWQGTGQSLGSGQSEAYSILPMPWQSQGIGSSPFGSLLGGSSSSVSNLPYVPSSRSAHVPRIGHSGLPVGTDSVTGSNLPMAMRERLKDKHWQFHLAKTLPNNHSQSPFMSSQICLVPYQPEDFNANPFQAQPAEPQREIDTYYGKLAVDTQRPWVEWWRPFYTGGMYEPGVPVFSDVNLLTPSFLVYGDYRTAVGIHRNNGERVRNWAQRLNLDMDLRLTGTERFHMFTGPLDHNGRFTRIDFSDGDPKFERELDFQLDTAFFEGDLGAMTGGWMGTDAPFDLPFTCGLVPLLYQNGIWMEDAIAGFAVGSPWRHNRALNWANFDATFFAGFNQVTSPAFQNDNNAAAVFGTAWFVEAYSGYIEMDYAYLDDLDGGGRSYHNAAVAYTRRYFGRISNSVRLIGNIGQSGPADARSADGGLLLFENSLISSQPSTLVPYWNFFVGSGRPQSVARAGNAGGILRNTGINFESDALTGYPTLNATGSNAYGGAIGVNLLSADFRQQWIVEFASLDTYGDPLLSAAAGPEYALGTRYQRALNNRSIWRIDFMNGWLDDAPDIFGTRTEFRWKF
ncbi:MAG: hypothetical protein ABL921_11605 [Pirellula sp.]